ncbi:MAG: FAD-dependent oxidoreductase, partial [Rhizobiales bacterium]|nr:FAD-dependent oxidoreductase [Hyphomicrobiales bacterium]
SDRIGGRVLTDATRFGIPCDEGAHWFYRSDVDPLVKLAKSAGLDMAETAVRQRLRIGRRFARENEVEAYFAAIVRANRAFGEGSRKGDVAAQRTLPKDLGEWLPSAEFALGPLTYGRGLDRLSAADLAMAAERDTPAFCRQGAGLLAQRLAENLTVTTGAPVRRIATWRGVSYVESTKGTLRARAVVVTAPIPVLAEKIRFDPVLPKSHLEALSKLVPGHLERVVLELPGNPLGLEPDSVIVEKAVDTRSAQLLANVGGSALSFVDLPGDVGQAMLGQGDAAMRAFALEWLATLFGTDVKSAVKRSHATRWGKAPWSLGAFTTAVPGGQSARKILMEPVRERVYFAGEALHETLWGTMAGAWESGERAAAAALRTMTVAPAASRPARTRQATEKPADEKPAAQRPGFFQFIR